jgi:polynucleotide 5'-kinase involved in rRNA processing
VNAYEALVESAVSSKRIVVLIGGLDSGKSTVARSLLRAAVERGRSAAFLDSDLGQTTIGPPATIGLKHIRDASILDDADALAVADALAFVGATSPEGHVLPLVAGVAQLYSRARAEGADFVAVDTSGMVSGIHGQVLKYHKLEMLHPDLVVGLQRGEELDPLLGIAQRFFGTEVVSLGVHPDVRPLSVEQRAEHRELAMKRYFSGELHRFRVKPTVFMPALPPMFDLAHLDHLVVGLSDGAGAYSGMGYLEWTPEEGVLRLISPVAQAPAALRLGSARLEGSHRVKRVDLRNLLGTE